MGNRPAIRNGNKKCGKRQNIYSKLREGAAIERAGLIGVFRDSGACLHHADDLGEIGGDNFVHVIEECGVFGLLRLIRRHGR